MRCPSPPLPPVTSATLPVRSMISPSSTRVSGCLAEPPARPRTVCCMAQGQASRRPPARGKDRLQAGTITGQYRIDGTWRLVMRLKDKVAIVTGGAHGMGEAEARLFAAEGAKVVVADILAADAETVVAAIRAGGGEATAAKIDVTSEAEWAGLIAGTVASYDRLDILVNNAGISGSSVGDPDGLDGWHRIVAVNQTSVFLGTRLAADQMAKTGGGAIVNISSI